MGSKIKINNKIRSKRMAGISALPRTHSRTHSPIDDDDDALTPPLPRTHSRTHSPIDDDALTPPLSRFERFKRYILTDKVLGKGSYGEVVVALDLENHGRKVAIKFCYISGCCAKVLEEVQMEARIGMQIPDHPNVCKTIDSFIIQGILYIVMEMVEGVSFDIYMRVNKLTDANLFTFGMILHQMASAIKHLHANQIIHRDIKPANFVISQNPDGSPLVKLIDFGFSTKYVDTVQKTQGTPIFVSPEVAREKDIDHKSDSWAFGVLILQLLTQKDLLWYLENVKRTDRAYQIIRNLTVNPFPAYLAENENPMFVLIANTAIKCLEIDKSKRSSVAEIAECLSVFKAQ